MTATSDLDERIALAGGGDVDAQLLLASMDYDGAGVSRDETTAAKWFARPAERDDPRAQYRLAVLATDPVEKAHWLAPLRRILDHLELPDSPQVLATPRATPEPAFAW